MGILEASIAGVLGQQSAPAGPQALNVTYVADDMASFSWSGVSVPGQTEWLVYRDGVLIATLLDPAISSFTAIGLSPSTTYTFHVEASDGAGTTSASNTDTATTVATITNEIVDRDGDVIRNAMSRSGSTYNATFNLGSPVVSDLTFNSVGGRGSGPLNVAGQDMRMLVGGDNTPETTMIWTFSVTADIENFWLTLRSIDDVDKRITNISQPIIAMWSVQTNAQYIPTIRNNGTELHGSVQPDANGDVVRVMFGPILAGTPLTMEIDTHGALENAVEVMFLDEFAAVLP